MAAMAAGRGGGARTLEAENERLRAELRAQPALAEVVEVIAGFMACWACTKSGSCCTCSASL